MRLHLFMIWEPLLGSVPGNVCVTRDQKRLDVCKANNTLALILSLSFPPHLKKLFLFLFCGQ